MRIGRLALEDGDLEACREAFEKVLKTEPKDSDGLQLKGFYHLERSEPGEAKKAFQRYLEIAPNGHTSGTSIEIGSNTETDASRQPRDVAREFLQRKGILD